MSEGQSLILTIVILVGITVYKWNSMGNTVMERTVGKYQKTS